MPDDEVRKTAEARLGRVLRGKYRLDPCVLGIGGMATVYAATHRNKKRFAIKMLHPELSMRANIRDRFLREGYVANSVEHAGAVAVLDDDVAEDGSAFLVMELLDGSALDELANKHEGHKLPVALVLSIGDGLLDVLSAAHAKGIVHRDLKPANVFLTNDGRIEVLDFGIARLHDETSQAQHATQTGAMLGTPAFMAPEQALAEQSNIDAQTDLWAVGATLFTLLSGALVHEGENASQLMIRAGTSKARPLATMAPEAPKPVVDAIDKALAFEKKDRWESARAMREALAKACIEATGAPIPPLPKTERVTGLEVTVASDPSVVNGAATTGASLSHAANEIADVSRRTGSSLRIPSLALRGVAILAAALVWGAHGGKTAATAPVAPASVTEASTPAPSSSVVRWADLAPSPADPRAAAKYRSGMELRWRGELAAGTHAIDEAITLDPDFASAHLQRFVNATELCPTDLAVARPQYQAASHARSALSERDRNVLDAMAPAVLDPPDLGELAVRLRALAARRPNDAQVVQLLAIAENKLFRFDASAVQARRTMALDPDEATPDAPLLLAQDLDSKESGQVLQDCIRRFPAAQSCRTELAVRLASTGACADLEVDARALMTLDPDFSRGPYVLVNALAGRGASTDALRLALDQAEAHLPRETAAA